MTFYNEPGFWAFMTALVTSLFGLLKLGFIYLERSNEKQAALSKSVEQFKSDNIQKSVDCFTDFMTQTKPLVSKHEEMMKDINNSIQMISTIEKGLTSMSAELKSQRDEFQQKLVNVTISFQKTIDRVDGFEKKLGNLGKVIKL